jgi:hypothetical protein
MHFDNTLDFLDLFLPINMSSASRARAFLWLCYHYLESSSDHVGLKNPFADPHTAHPKKIPPLIKLTQEEMAQENVDSEDEVAWGEKMLLQRKEFQAKMEKGKDKKGDDGEDEPAEGTQEAETKEKGKAKAKASAKDVAAAKATAKEKKAAADKARRQRQKEAKRERELAPPALDVEDVANDELCKNGLVTCSFDPSLNSYKDQAPGRERHHPQSKVPPQPRSQHPSRSNYLTRQMRTPSPPHHHRYAPYSLSSSPAVASTSNHSATKQLVSRPYSHKSHRRRKESVPSPQRTMLQRACSFTARDITGS